MRAREALTELQTAAGATIGEVGGHPTPLKFSAAGDSACGAVHRRWGLMDLGWLQLLRFTGEERAAFLHNMTTSHVNGLQAGQTQASTVCDVTGHLVGAMRLWNTGDAIWAQLQPQCKDATVQILDQHLIMEDVEIAEVHDAWLTLGLAGPAAAGVLESTLGFTVPGPGEAAVARWHGLDIHLVATRHTGERGVDLVAPQELAVELWQALAPVAAASEGALVGFDALNTLRIEAGIPWWGSELDNSVLMLEAGMDDAIHFQKGCYLGQETLARVHFRGHTNRQLMGLLLPHGALPAAGAELFSGDRGAGRVTSATYSAACGRNIALGYVRREFLAAGTVLQLGQGGADVVVEALPFVQPA